jgi:hypothetical protein
MNPYTLFFFRYRFVFGFSPEGEHKVRPYIGHWLSFGFCLRQHFPLTFTYAPYINRGYYMKQADHY